jgi:molybdopterin/thiamine biosynthesis adenylyltransferase
VEGAEAVRSFEYRPDAESDGIVDGAGDAIRTLVVVGLGNIGSNLVDAIVRSLSPLTDRLILIDPDTYEAANLAGQRIDASDVGHPKAIVQARYALRRRPFLSVVAYVSRVEEVPPGVLRGALVASCVDSRAARQSIAEMAWRMGAPFVDAAVDATVPAVRIAGYRPGPDSACLECAFHDDDYAAIEQRVACVS